MSARPPDGGMRDALIGERQERCAEQCEPGAHSEPRGPIHDRVDRYPAQHDEGPVTGVLRDVDEVLALERPLEHERGEHQRVADIGDEVKVCRPISIHRTDPYALSSQRTLNAVNSIQRTPHRARENTEHTTIPMRTWRRSR